MSGPESLSGTSAGTPDGAPFCPRCGHPDAEGEHAACREAMALEPPRYCVRCRRRMIVQVLPTGWTARCSAHGELPPVRTSAVRTSALRTSAVPPALRP